MQIPKTLSISQDEKARILARRRASKIIDNLPDDPLPAPRSPEQIAEDEAPTIGATPAIAPDRANPDPSANPADSSQELSDLDTHLLAAELLRRQYARTSLVHFANAVDVPGVPPNDDEEEALLEPVETSMALHHRVMLYAIQNCMETPFGRVMIMAPPGSAKSTMASVVAPTWYMGKHKNSEIILASYGGELARKHSRRARQICRSEKYSSIWDESTQLAKDQKNINEWALTNGSSYKAAGLLASLTGSRAAGAIIDDPIAGRQEADSEAHRKAVKGAFDDDLKTRLKPNAWLIVINTRWHQDDLSGHILPEDYAGQTGYIKCKDGMTWYVLNMPAQAEHEDDPLGRPIGAYLWPEWFPERHWLQYQSNPRTWASLFQGRPAGGSGLDFRWEDFRFYDPDLRPGAVTLPHLPQALPLHRTRYGASDFAAKPDRTADFTEHAIASVDKDLNLYVEDWWFGQKDTGHTIDQFITLVREHKPYRWWDEGNVIGHAIAPARNAAMRQANVFVTTEQLPSIKSKALKLASLQARVSNHTVYFPLPEKRPWVRRVIQQLVDFPAARHDDAADVMGLFGRGIDSMIQPFVPSENVKKVLEPFTAAWLEYEESSSATPRYS